MQARAVLFTGVDRVEFGSVEIPDPEAGEVLIEAAYTCVSPGTELRCLSGKQDGTAGWPFIPGYALAGRVIARGPETRLPIGAPVLCAGTSRSSALQLWGGHVSHAVQKESAVFPVPPGVDLRDASLARLAAIAYHGLRMSRPLPHEAVAVVGLGIIGQLSARLHALTGAQVAAADLAPARVQVARAAGIEAFVPEEDLAAAFRGVFPDGADVVVDSTGVPAVLPEAVRVARDQPYDDALPGGARFLIQGSYPADFSVPYFAAFRKELTFLLARDRQPRDMRTALELIRRGNLRVRDLASEVRLPEEAPEVYAGLRDPGSGVLTALFDWTAAGQRHGPANDEMLSS